MLLFVWMISHDSSGYSSYVKSQTPLRCSKPYVPGFRQRSVPTSAKLCGFEATMVENLKTLFLLKFFISMVLFMNF